MSTSFSSGVLTTPHTRHYPCHHPWLPRGTNYTSYRAVALPKLRKRGQVRPPPPPHTFLWPDWTSHSFSVCWSCSIPSVSFGVQQCFPAERPGKGVGLWHGEQLTGCPGMVSFISQPKDIKTEHEVNSLGFNVIPVLERTAFSLLSVPRPPLTVTGGRVHLVLVWISLHSCIPEMENASQCLSTVHEGQCGFWLLFCSKVFVLRLCPSCLGCVVCYSAHKCFFQRIWLIFELLLEHFTMSLNKHLCILCRGIRPSSSLSHQICYPLFACLFLCFLYCMCSNKPV